MVNKVALVEEVTIKQANIKDAERITTLGEQLGYSLTIQQVEQRLNKIQNDAEHIVYVATLANEYVIGWAHAHICDLLIMPKQAILLGLVVDKDYHHHGIGRYLMQYIEQWAVLKECDGVMLRSNIKRKEAYLFYEKIGYINIKQSLAFYKQLI
ncbi:GCN5-related N-acetyltransferase [Trichormus variabilis ATCC 29413]|uniref:GCN5-related N-acetyltransferase n=2 Tax=Anabaena variabilis TaxID=264691 RepID=Q3M5R1_TRIV2|nr:MULTISPECIES: GNAT family N-acetyltransferase [Nostocaceae]ABA23675.1 GCN5-related N-acetyltransferase [Trichormus variabilis ATCC 29413]MBC1213169.1 GNAT family N-acetyltransferase [Trichormus variabilis ARAD]MBC1253958.1 GNAT family N-acetyltransferase [Trichormus variabilis V5]MBC1265599.1 GNAT family N-acetyltransferase [Trichormus variabilis FSR]MBC1301730.1 GNAT family N-acetyltransferase [Trichormus variabilis N2B]